MSQTLLTVLRTLILLPCIAILAACNGVPVNVPPADTPKLESVNLVGQRVCGSFTNSTTTFNFVCDPLPTSIGTGWLLTPLRKPHPGNPNWSIVNRGIVFTISAPTLTSIEVAYRAGSGTRFVLAQVAPGPGRPQMLIPGGPGEVEVAATDDGMRKIWKVAVQTNSCFEKLEMEVVNISRSLRSGALPIHVLRMPAETFCISTPPVGSGLPPSFGTARTGGVGMGPTGSSPTGPCSGGASRTLFGFCELCPPSAPRSLAQYTGIESCSLADAIATMGYGPGSTKGQLCSLSQVASEAQCEGP